MKKYLIPETGQFYKANLHCHTTISDGSMTPEQVKQHYLCHGYSIIAFTDHCVLIPHPELKDDHFLPLNGFETEIIAPGEEKTPRKKHCHLCFVALDENNVTMTVYGYGHGVGMSQTGANAMAGAGNSYATILKHYYTGVELEPYM